MGRNSVKWMKSPTSLIFQGQREIFVHPNFLITPKSSKFVSMRGFLKVFSVRQEEILPNMA